MAGSAFRIRLLIGVSVCMAAIAMAPTGAVSAEQCVRIAVPERGGENASIDPTVAVTQGDFFNVNALYEPIVWIDNNLEAQPFLAESWESNEAATEWTFNLRKGVKFHDGSELKAADVVYTYRRVLDPNTGVAAKELAFVTPDGVEAVDDHTVKFTVKDPVVEFPLLIANKFAYVSKADVSAGQLAMRSYGTGPFMIEGFVPNEPVVVFGRNPDYWQAGLPKAGCIELSAIAEPLARAAAVTTGEIDVVSSADPTTFEMLKGSGSAELVQSVRGTLLAMSMFIDTPPFDDPKVRQALKIVMDRQAILDTVLLGYGSIANDNPIPLDSADAWRADPIPQDIEQARKLLAEAGHADGLSVDLYTGSIMAGTLNLAQAYQQMAAQAGITVNIVNTPAETYWDDVWLKKSFASTFWGARPTSSALSIAYRKGATYNETHWYRDEYDALLDKANATLDVEQRRALLKQASQMLAQEGGVVAPVFSRMVAAVRKGCSGYQPHSDVNRAELRHVACE